MNEYNLNNSYLLEDRAPAFLGEETENFDKVPISQKMTLSIREAAEYSNIGIGKITSLLKEPNCSFVLYVGTKKLVKRKAFEEYIAKHVAI